MSDPKHSLPDDPSSNLLNLVAIAATMTLVGATLAWMMSGTTPTSSSVDGSYTIQNILPALLVVLMLAMGWLSMNRVAGKLRTLSSHARVDSLSGLPNRLELQRLLRQNAKNRNLGSSAALALIDLDAFKLINDNHGHSTGDAVIRHVAALLKANAPAHATVARLGGDEFAVFFEREGERAEYWLTKFLSDLSQPAMIDRLNIRLGASIGVTFVGTSLSVDLALRQADVAMYMAKRRGKMQIASYDETMEAPIRQRIALKDDLIRAIDDNQIKVKYQPIMSAKTGKIESVEALARWASPARGIVPTESFIGAAEEFGLIGKLGENILQSVIADLPRLPDVRVAINVSTAQIAKFEFTDMLIGQLEGGHIAGDRIDIEITETHLVQNPALIADAMTRLSKWGVRFVLDDFGTGYASIGFLRQFAFDAIKIDRTITEECLVSEQARSIVAAIVSMAHAYDMLVVAEGIETEEHAAMAKIAGCDQLQGWYFSRAISADDANIYKESHLLKMAS